MAGLTRRIPLGSAWRAGRMRRASIPAGLNLPTDGIICMGTILTAIDLKIDRHRCKSAVLEELFGDLPPKLVTGDVRVSGLELSAVDG